MNHRFEFIRFFILLFVIAVIAETGCRENVLINSRLSPANDTVGVSDTFLSCITHTYLTDSILTSTNLGGIAVYQGVGCLTDPYFGTLTGSTYFQIIPTDYTSELYDSATIDSAFLVLPYSGFIYGDTTNYSINQSFQVFYLMDTMSINTNYFNYSTTPIDLANPLSEPYNISINHLQDSFGINQLSQDYPSLRIPLKLPNLLSHLLPAQAYLDSSNPIQYWLDAFNGICVRPTNTSKFTNAMPYFRLDGTDTFSEAGVNIYYHINGFPSVPYIEPYYFNTSVCGHYNNISKSFGHYPVSRLYSSRMPNDSIIALQNSPGPGIDVIIPGITKLPKGIIINKVELQLTMLPQYNSDTLFGPERIYALGVANSTYPVGLGAGTSYIIADQYPTTSLTPLTVLDGFEHNIVKNGNTYQTFTIDFPRELMASIAANNDTLHLQISGTTDFYGAFHMVAAGGNYSDPNYRAKVLIVYSKLKK